MDFLDISALGVMADHFSTRVRVARVGADALITIDGNPNQRILLDGIGNGTAITQQNFIL